MKKANLSKMNWLKNKVNQSIPGKSVNNQNINDLKCQSAGKSDRRNYVSDDDRLEKQFILYIADIKRLVHTGNPDINIPELGMSVSQNVIQAACDNLRSMVTLISSQNTSPESTYNLLDILCSETFVKFMLTWTRFCAHQNEFIDELIEEQLFLYEVFITQSNQKFMMEVELLQPLLELLNLCSLKLQIDWNCNLSLEEKFIFTLHQMCIGITMHPGLLDLLFDSSSSEDKFSVFNLLVPFVHRDGVIGQQARDALLLIMSLSAKHDKIGLFIANESNFCPVLATGLSGLYSSLPCKLEYPSDDWHHLSEEDVSQISDLKMFLNSLGFCNAVIQASHPAICSRLLEFIMDGFLLPVIGPALSQTTIEEAVAATAYFDLFIRTITEPSLLKVFVDFVLLRRVDEVLVLDMLIARISSQLTRLCVVTLRLFYSLVDLNCEDVMFYLVFKHIVPGKHIMLSQHHSVKEVDYYAVDAGKFLSMIPECCQLSHGDNVSIGNPETSEEDKHSTKLSRFNLRSRKGNNSFSSLSPLLKKNRSSKSDMPPNHISLPSSTYEDPSYMEYLSWAHYMISSCRESCKHWLFKYDATQSHLIKEMDVTSETAKMTINGGTDLEENGVTNMVSKDCDLISPADNELVENIDVLAYFEHQLNECKDYAKGDSNLPDLLKEIDQLYGQVHINSKANSNIAKKLSFKERVPKDVTNYDLLKELPISCDKPSLGPFLEALFSRVERMVQSTLYVNLQLTSLIARLSCYPHPLLRSLILSHNLIFQPSVKSFLQALNSVKKKLEDYLHNIPQKTACLNQAHQFLVFRMNPDIYLMPSESSKRDNKRRSSGIHELFRTNQKQNRLTLFNSSAQYIHHQNGMENTEKESIERKNAIYAALVFKEFLKELAAISQEHTIVGLS